MWRDPEGTVLRIVSQTENDKPFHLTCVIDKDQAHRNGEDWWWWPAVGKRDKLPAVRDISPRHVRDGMLTTVNNNGLCI